MPPLTPAQTQFFQDNGFLIIDPEIANATLDGVVRDLDGRYPDPVQPDGVQPATRIQDAWQVSRSAHRIATAAKVLAVLRQLYGREPLPFQTLNFPVGTNQQPHSDAVTFNSCPPSFVCGVWVALESAGPQNGAAVCYPGSHKLPEYDMADFGAPAAAESYPQYEEFIARVIEVNGLEPHYAELHKGQALVWAANLIHGDSFRQDPGRTRHSQLTRYYFEGCRYWTPMLSRGTEVSWQQPEWIPKEVPQR
jgi:Phytanoyl-CoA dioxygenase (PhyH)